MRVEAQGALDGLTVEDAALRNLAGVYLVGLDRDEGAIAPVAPSQVLHGGDVLSFAGSLTDVRDLERLDGLATEEQEHVDLVTGAATFRYYEAVIGPESPLVRRTLAETGFRSAYGAAVMAIHRAGVRVDGKLGKVRLEVGDVLLLVGPMGFRREYDSTRDFLLVAPLFVRPAPPEPRRVALVSLVVLAMVVAAGTGLVSILQSSLAAVLVLTVTGVLRLREARDSVDLDVVLVVAAALGIGKAVELSGLAAVAADAISGVAEQLGSVGGLALVMFATIVLTEVISNAAARRPDGPDRDPRGGRGTGRPTVVRDRCGRDGQRVVPHAGRLPDQHDRLRPRRLPLHRLLAPRAPGRDHELRHHAGGRQHALVSAGCVDRRNAPTATGSRGPHGSPGCG